MAGHRLNTPTRVRAWLVTGPLGHLYGGLMDWAQLLARVARARARGSDPWAS